MNITMFHLIQFHNKQKYKKNIEHNNIHGYGSKRKIIINKTNIKQKKIKF